MTEARLTSGVNFNSAQSLAESSITELRSLATSAANPPASHAVTLDMPDFSALQNAWGWQDESKADKLKAVEALKTWLGSNPSSRQETTSALCAALTDDLKLITLSQSKTFLSFDTTRQTACASAISVTITESTAESLISFTADTLRNKAIDKAAGAAVSADGYVPNGKNNTHGAGWGGGRKSIITAPATDAARQWDGWGTALKPALEPITLARKPLAERTVAANVLTWGTGGVNVDGCRVGVNGGTAKGSKPQGKGNGMYGAGLHGACEITRLGAGRFPANLIHDGSDEVVELFPVTSSGFMRGGEKASKGAGMFGGGQSNADTYGDTGSAARFFYCAKASRSEREAGLEGDKCTHPTVKPIALMRYLCRLVTPPGGVVLDPFAGSGTTGCAAVLEGFGFIGMEREEEYVEIARRRIQYWGEQGE